MSKSKITHKKNNWGITFHSTFKEMDEARAQAMAQLSGTEHLHNATELIKRIYAEELKKPMEKKIKFRN